MAKKLRGRRTELSAADEADLLSRVAAGEKPALADLYRQYHAPLFRFAFRLTHSYGAAEELVNDVMLAVWNGAAKFRNGSKISTWIFGIAYRQCMSHLRKRRVPTVDDAAIEQIADECGDGFEDGQWVEQGLELLPDEQRLCIVLVFFVGCSYGEVAEITGCKEATVKTRMFHARRKLRNTLPILAQPVSEGAAH